VSLCEANEWGSVNRQCPFNAFLDFGNQRRRRQNDEDLERRRRDLERQGGQQKPAFIPPSF